MSIIDNIRNIFKNDVKNVANKESKDIKDLKTETTRFRTRQTIENWMVAIQSAERIEIPSRNLLHDIYRTVILDAKVSGKMNNRLNKTLLQDFKIIKGDERQDKIEEIFHNLWFRELMKYIVESKFWGFSLIQLGDIEENKFKGVENINRYYVIPEKFQLKKNIVDTIGIDIVGSEYEDWLIFVDNGDLGLLVKIAQYALYKKEVVALYNEYIEVYGMPTRVAKIGPATNQAAVSDMLRHMGSNAFGIFDKDTDIEFITGRSESYDNIYQRLIDWCDEQIAYLISGETMTDKDGSSYAQANIHKGVADMTSFMDNLLIEDVVNNQLIPKMIKLGFTELTGCKFEFFYNDELSTEAQFNIDKEIMKYFDIDEEYLMNKYGTKIKGVKPKTEGIFNLSDLKNKYKL